MPKEKTPSQIHEGHRERLLHIVAENGLENLSEVQQLEFLLTLAIPRKDTNPIAHNLLEQFGSIASVLDASPQLVANTGIVGLRTAKILHAMASVHACYQKSRLNKKIKLTNNSLLNEFCKEFLQAKPHEELFLFGLDSRQQLISVECIKKGDAHSVRFEMKDINQFLVRSHAASVFLAHSHPSLNAHPSNADVQTTKVIQQFLSILNIPLLDHVIVAGNDTFSFFQNNLFSKMKDVSENALFQTVVSVASPSESEVVWE